MQFQELAALSRAVSETSARLGKVERLADFLKRLAPFEIEIAIAFLSGTPRQGRIGAGGRLLHALSGERAAESPTLTLADVDEAFARVAATGGAGAQRARAEILRGLLARSTADEKDLILRLIAGELRQGALEGVLADAVARAAGVPAPRVRRAAMMAGSLAAPARAALVDGDAALDAFLIQLFNPVQPMLAGSADSIDDAVSELGETALEYKLDGARIQVHKSGDVIRVYTRNLREVTDAVPEVVETAAALPARDIILDGEVIALRPDGRPWPFQITMKRFGRKLDVDALRRDLPLTPAFFDALYLDGHPLIDEPLETRIAAVSPILPAASFVPRTVTASAEDAAAFLERALAAGHEGLVAKALDAPYTAGRRGRAWIKVKRPRTLDLVVLAAEWGHGRRRGTLSNLHLGARDETGGFVMLGKTFKGMTDEMLAWQTARLLDLEVARDQFTVYVRPELVVEIAFNDVQDSPQYPGGLALRFARVKRYRQDKMAGDADTIETVRAFADTGT